MDLKEIRSNWNGYATKDPLFGVLSHPDKRNGKWDVDEFFKTGNEEIDSIIKEVSALKIPLDFERALDFGCAVGRLTNALCEHFEQVDGVDISEKMIHLAKQYNRYGDRCTFHVNIEDDLRLFDDNSFDFIYSNIVLQHMDPAYSKKYLIEFLRVLQPAGILVFQLPSDYIGAQSVKKAKHTGIKYHLKETVKKILPVKILDWVRQYQAKNQPLMEMYGIPQKQVLDFLNNAGGSTIHISENGNAGKDWTSFTYFVNKQAIAQSVNGKQTE